MRRVMIGTPCYDGKLDALYVDSLINTIRQCPKDISLFPVWIPGDALVQRARNKLMKIAIEVDIDELVFIDADITWTAENFYKLLSYDLDIIGGLYRQKTETHTAVVRLKEGVKQNNKLLEVSGIGCGFMRLRKTAIKKLWDNATPYKNGPDEAREVFKVDIDGGELAGEDIYMCKKWTELGGSIFVDTSIRCGHIGSKVYQLA